MTTTSPHATPLERFSHQHKYRTNLDGLTLAGVNSNSIHNKGVLSPYITVIFCEGCGHIAFDANHPTVIKVDAALKEPTS